MGIVNLTTGSWRPLAVRYRDLTTLDAETALMLHELGDELSQPGQALAPEELGAVAQAVLGRRIDGVDEPMAVISRDARAASVLRVGDLDDDLATARSEAFAMLAATAATTMDAAIRTFHLDRARRDLEFKTRHDSLTGLLNREGILLELDRVIGRLGEGRRALLLFLDLDGFKAINDTYGHDAGDVVLVEVGARLTRSVPEGAAVARLGGDEFVVVVEDREPELARHLRSIIEQPILAAPDTTVHVGASIGIEILHDPEATTEQVLRQADQKMYEQKSQRKAGKGGGARGAHFVPDAAGPEAVSQRVPDELAPIPHAPPTTAPAPVATAAPTPAPAPVTTPTDEPVVREQPGGSGDSAEESVDELTSSLFAELRSAKQQYVHQD
jgi:diguanylate cyclase (GGDEF)-like protein